jgi:hypothetical protein
MEPIEGATLRGDTAYPRTAEDDKRYTIMRLPKDQTLLEKVKNN